MGMHIAHGMQGYFMGIAYAELTQIDSTESTCWPGKHGNLNTANMHMTSNNAQGLFNNSMNLYSHSANVLSASSVMAMRTEY